VLFNGLQDTSPLAIEPFVKPLSIRFAWLHSYFAAHTNYALHFRF